MSVSVGTAARGAWQGKTLARIFFDEALRRHSAGLEGRALDLASGTSYLSLLPQTLEVIRTNRSESGDIRVVDFNAKLPFEDESFDSVFLFNALYIADNPEMLAREVWRVLKPRAKWLILSPFVANEMSDPHDYRRFTKEGLEQLCTQAGFTTVEVERQGERASAATHLMHPFFLFNVMRALIFPVALLFDWLVPARVRREHPTPLSYFVVCKK